LLGLQDVADFYTFLQCAARDVAANKASVLQAVGDDIMGHAKAWGMLALEQVGRP